MYITKFTMRLGITYFLCLLLSFLVLTCKPIEYGTKYLSLTEQKYPEKFPCEIKFVVKEKWDRNKYIHIGTCISKLTPIYKLNSVENEAFNAVKNCACQKGGDVVKIVHQDETIYTTYSLYGTVTSSYVAHDDVIGEVYIIGE